jgi:uncharacterized protein YqgC (DUF456 family)
LDTVLLAILAFVLIFAGLAGVFLPILPGTPLAWLGLFIFAIGTGFEKISILATVLLFILMLVTLLMDVLAPVIGAGKNKAGKWGIIGTSIGLIAGFWVLGFWGIIIGPFLGAFLGELLARKPAGQAVKSAVGAFLGFVFGALFKVFYIFVLLGFLISSLFK